MNNSYFFHLMHDFNKGHKKELMKCIHIDCGGFNQTLLRTCKDNLIDIWPRNSEVTLLTLSELDYFSCSNEIEIVSNCVKKSIEEICDKEEVEFLPINTFFENENTKYKNKYWVIHIKKILDAINIERTKWISKKIPEKFDSQSYMNIIKPNLELSKIRDFKIFRIEFNGKVMYPVYLAKEVRDLLIKAKCVEGMDFSPVMVS